MSIFRFLRGLPVALPIGSLNELRISLCRDVHGALLPTTVYVIGVSS